ncbi:MAG: hypothetical protein AAB131_23440, partial [Actinomycetota bacterium]
MSEGFVPRTTASTNECGLHFGASLVVRAEQEGVAVSALQEPVREVQGASRFAYRGERLRHTERVHSPRLGLPKRGGKSLRRVFLELEIDVRLVDDGALGRLAVKLDRFVVDLLAERRVTIQSGPRSLLANDLLQGCPRSLRVAGQHDHALQRRQSARRRAVIVEEADDARIDLGLAKDSIAIFLQVVAECLSLKKLAADELDAVQVLFGLVALAIGPLLRGDLRLQVLHAPQEEAQHSAAIVAADLV